MSRPDASDNPGAAAAAEPPQGERPAAAVAPAAEQAAPSAAPTKRRRWVLLLAGPIAVAVGAGAFWVSGGRYITTDNAYVGAPKVSVAPEVTGPVASVSVTEGQHVNAGDLLFTLDRESYQIAADTARAQIASAELSLAALKESYEKAQKDIGVQSSDVDYQKRNYDRIASLAGRQVSSAADLDRARHDLDNARLQLEATRNTAQQILAQLGGDPDLAAEKYPPYAQAQAQLAAAERNLRLTEVRAPISGVATQTSSLVKGRYLVPGTAALALVDTDRVWVDANPKETDVESVHPGQPVEVTVDAYPDHVFHGSVEAIAPGTGAQFSVLPAQNSSGNWVKVVQRVPLRIRIDRRQDDPELAAGMSAYVSIDTGRERSFGDLLGTTSVAAKQ